MPKNLIKRFTPNHETIRNHKHLRVFGQLLHDPNLWHMNRRSVAGAFAVGLFWAMIPMPFQMVAAAATAIPTRVNMPLSVALVWISNPITMPPMFYFNYLVGTWITGEPAMNGHFELTMEWFTQSMGNIWQPLYLGSLVCGVIAALAGYLGIRGLWRMHIISHWKNRRANK
ncbi:DUF2062 domain-containing protein [Sedimenticola selenatireducens]|jgi:hypothetical protein|uniref:DUF2062 domain-containing protein n=1 Tax=Sedimenticola selenatireducens TaxID=191960 RepID=A0A558DJU3_9GAMM|nr:DUF2062 domain-containing protein [Sedimenticola selenatireducens]TVO68872.1 DUF2062 domain-containing protein [Sedimenticola selenatireducens]TVT61244.1 MAG: DUF2062 domain-containing protein [Sedimenticola selenatireducens]